MQAKEGGGGGGLITFPRIGNAVEPRRLLTAVAAAALGGFLEDRSLRCSRYGGVLVSKPLPFL